MLNQGSGLGLGGLGFGGLGCPGKSTLTSLPWRRAAVLQAMPGALAQT